jgi:hypothetical protein
MSLSAYYSVLFSCLGPRSDHCNAAGSFVSSREKPWLAIQAHAMPMGHILSFQQQSR